MNPNHRLLCESWVEKRPEVSHITSRGTSSSKQTAKWKTRYAMLVVSSETKSREVKFYQKKPRSYTEITDDIVKLQPWKYVVDIPSWIVDKGRPHVLRLRLLPASVVPGQHCLLQIAYQSSEEATAWMRCIQNQTKLTSGTQGHSFGVVAEECSATARIGVAGKHCLLFVAPSQVILAHKTDRSVVCAWPLETIRSYASDDDRRFVIEAGRGAPLGEGVYSFRTRENDDNVLFDLLDHYTTTATVEPPTRQPKKRVTESGNHQVGLSPIRPEPIALKQSPKVRKGQKYPTRQDSDCVPLITLNASSGSSASEYDKPPKKPPLPVSRVPMPHVLPKSTVVPTKAKVISTTKGHTSAADSKGAETKKKDRCLYELDKILHNLEDDIHSSKENILSIIDSQSEDGRVVLETREQTSRNASRVIKSDAEPNSATARSDNDTNFVKYPPYAKIDSSKKKPGPAS